MTASGLPSQPRCQRLPDGSSVRITLLSSVACPSATSCVAIGSYTDANENGGGLIETLSNGTWTAVVAPSPADGRGGGLSAISCVSPSYCVAVGQYQDSHGATAGLIETLNDGVWTATGAPAPPGGSSPELSSVSCGATGSCAAVTQFSGVIETLANGTWTALNGPMPANLNSTPPAGQGVNMNSVSCGSAGSLRRHRDLPEYPGQ